MICLQTTQETDNGIGCFAMSRVFYPYIPIRGVIIHEI